MTSHALRGLAALRPRRTTLLWGAVVVNTELLLVLLYFALADVRPHAVLTYVYPFVWINVAAWAVARTTPAPAPRRTRRLAALAGVGYFLLLGGVGGVYALGGTGVGARIAWLPPGWGPALVYGGDALTVTLMPYKVVGYAALAYLVYATVRDTAGSAVSAVVGLFSCVSCTWPVAASVLTGVFGSASAVAFATSRPYGLSTLVYLSAVALLYWRPRLSARGT